MRVEITVGSRQNLKISALRCSSDNPGRHLQTIWKNLLEPSAVDLTPFFGRRTWRLPHAQRLFWAP